MGSTGYGRCMSCLDRLSTGRRVTGARLLGEAIYRRLTTPRGTVANAPTYGYDLSAYVGSVGGRVAAAALPAVVESEILKDNRVASVEAAVTRDVDGSSETFTVEISVTPADETSTFDLTLAVSDVSVDLIGILP